MSEHEEQALLFEWAQLQQHHIPELALLFAIPNAGKRSYAAASYMQAEGLKSGVPDICLPIARGGWHSLFIELKYGKNTPSAEQTAWIAALKEHGNAAYIAWGFEAARDLILCYLEGRL